MMKKFLFIIILNHLLFNSSFTQDTILLLNSDIVFLDSYRTDSVSRKLFYENKRGKEKFFYFDHIFSITDTSGNESVYFTPRYIDSVYYTHENMRSYLQGSRDGYYSYKAPLATAGGFIIGSAGAFFIDVPLYALVPSAGYGATLSLTSPSEKRIIKKHPEYAGDQYYINGYKEAAASKRATNGIKGALFGIIIGFTTSILIDQIH